MDLTKYKHPYALPTPTQFGVLTRSQRHAFEIVGVTDGIVKDDANIARYAKARDSYNQKKRELRELFEKDAIEAVGLENHPNKDKIFSKAWDDGHAHGLQEVMGCLEQLADLVDDDPRNQPIMRHRLLDRFRAGRGGQFHRPVLDAIFKKLTRREADVLMELIKHLEDAAEQTGQRNGSRLRSRL